MITFNSENARRFTDENGFRNALKKAAGAYRGVLSGKVAGNEWLGWRRILDDPDDAELDRIEQCASQIRKQADIFIVCGIGGSYMGAKAVVQALRGGQTLQKPEILFAGHQMGGRYLEQLIDYLEQPKADGSPKSVCMNVISKSGTTLETALTFRILRNWFDRSYGDSAPERIFVTTAPSGGVLNDMAGLFGYEKFVIPDDIGGRFSVLTPVGLLPASVAGIDIRLLIEGAVTQFRTCETRADEITEYAALRYYFQKNGKKLDVIGSFEPGLQSLTGWLQQLLGESEGKEGKGLFPVPAAYSTDLHSIGQMIQQGPRNMIETLLAVEEPLSDLTVSEEAQDTDGLGYLSGRLLYDINRQALNGTVEAHAGGGVPVFLIGIRSLDARNLGGLIYFYQLFTAVYVSMLGVNPFDQPGVEDYKKAMYRNLGA